MNLYNEFVNYLENTPRDKVLRDWALSGEYDEIGPTVEEFLLANQDRDDFTLVIESKEVIQEQIKPEFSTGFFFKQNIWNTQLFH